MLKPLLCLCLCLAYFGPGTGFADVTGGFVPHEEDLAGVRLRSMGNTGGSELFLGVPDLGVGENRTEADVTWSNGDFPFTFTIDRSNDLLQIEIANQVLVYPNLSARIAARTSGFYTLLDLNLLQIDVAQRDAGTTVQILNARLNGEDIGDFVPPQNGFFTWTVTGECVTFPETATVTGTLRLDGTFGRSQELSRVEIKAGVLESDGLSCVNAGIFKDGFEGPDPD